MSPDRTIVHLVKKKIPDPLPLSRIMACTLLSLNYAPVKGSSLRVPACLHVLKNELFKDE